MDPVDASNADGSNLDRYWYASDSPYRDTDPDGRQDQDGNKKPPPQPMTGGLTVGGSGAAYVSVTAFDVRTKSEERAAGSGNGGSSTNSPTTNGASKPNGMLGPYKKLSQAAQGGLDEIGSRGEKYEYDGLLFGSSGAYYATFPVTSHKMEGFATSITSHPAGVYHSHGEGIFMYPDYFSIADVKMAQQLGVPSFIGSYDTRSIRMFDPNTMQPDSRRDFKWVYYYWYVSWRIDMLRLLPLILLGSALLVHTTVRAAGLDCGPNTISNTPECLSKAVFEGKDADMPRGIAYQMAIEPVRDKNGNLIVPTSIPAAFQQLNKMLPHWYLNALRRSRNDNECDVIVNGFSYGGLILMWVSANWELDNDNSLLRKKFLQMGFRYNDEIDQALSFGFCTYVKSDDDEQKGMETIKKRVSPPQKPA